MRQQHVSTALATTLLAIALPAHAADTDARAFLNGRGEGSLQNPVALGTEARVQTLCDELQRSGPVKDGDAFARGLARHELKLKRKAARRGVYSVQVPPRGFKFGDYRYEKGKLPLDLDHPMRALDGALSLSIAERQGSAFKLSPEEASALVARHADKKVALEVLFRVDSGAGDTSACFSPAKSSAFTLHVEPLSYTLVDADTHQTLAQRTTRAMKKLKEWLAPGEAVVRITVQSIDGAHDADQLANAIDAKKKELEACLEPVMKSGAETAVLGYGATIAPTGALKDLQLEVEAIDQAGAAPCVEKVLASVTTAKSAKPSRAHLSIRVERGAESLSD